MPYAVVAEKLKRIPEQYLDEVSDFFDFILFRTQAGHTDIPNGELAAAMQESEEMLSDPDAPRFDTVEALFADLDAED